MFIHFCRLLSHPPFVTQCHAICVTYVCIVKDYLPLLISSLLSPSSPLSIISLSLSLSLACNDLVASGRDRKPNALVQVAVIDPHKQHLVSHTCTEIVEVRPTRTYTHTCHTILSLSLSLPLTDL